MAAFEAGNIPLYLAVEISRAPDESIQDSLTEALLNGTIKGKQINIIKRIIDNRKMEIKVQLIKHSQRSEFKRNTLQKNSLQCIKKAQMNTKKFRLKHGTPVKLSCW